MTNAGLTSKRNGKYFLTSFGKVVYKAQILIGKAEQNIWKLKAIDSIESSNEAWTAEERRRIIETLILDNDLKEILLSPNINNLAEKENNPELIVPQQ